MIIGSRTMNVSMFFIILIIILIFLYAWMTFIILYYNVGYSDDYNCGIMKNLNRWN